MIRPRSLAFLARPRSWVILAALCLVVPLSTASAADIMVTSDADSGAGTLRDAIETAVSGDRIVFDIPGVPTIQLLSDLPTISGDIAFANANPVDVTIDRNGNGPLVFQVGAVDPTSLNIVDGLGGTPIDIQASAGSTLYGADRLSANIVNPGTMAPGPAPTAGSIGTFDLTGDLDATGATFELDLQSSGGPLQSDLIDVDGVLTVSGATLQPNFVGDQFQIGDNFLVINSTNPIVGPFANETDAFALPDQPFLEAVADGSPANQFGFDIQDNGASFASVTAGCNQLSAAAALDEFFGRPVPPTAVDALRNGTFSQVDNAINQLSGSIYPSLVSAELNHIQANLDSIRDHVVLRGDPNYRSAILVPWVRGYGIAATAETDDCLTPGYRYEVGGVELGSVVNLSDGVSAFGYTHLANASMNVRGVDQHADVNAYRFGGGFQYVGYDAYVFATGGGGVQDYDVRRSLDAFAGSTFVESSFDGSASFGYVEVGSVYGQAPAAFNPYLALQSSRVSVDPVVETGDAEFALSNPGIDGDSLRGSLGIAYDQTGPTPIGPARSRLRAGWLHEFLDSNESVRSVFADTNPTAIFVDDRGVSLGRDWGLVGYELEWAIFHHGQLSAGYQGQFNSQSAFSSFLAGAEWLW
jgi:uncharacterized protein with beta-barrel porin domain